MSELQKVNFEMMLSQSEITVEHDLYVMGATQVFDDGTIQALAGNGFVVRLKNRDEREKLFDALHQGIPVDMDVLRKRFVDAGFNVGD